MTVGIGIINFRRPGSSRQLAERLSTLRAVSNESFDLGGIWIIDNSGDVGEIVTLGIQVIRLNNPGYAAAANEFFRVARAEGCTHLLVLTHEVEFEPAIVPKMLSRLRSDPALGAVAPTLVDSAGRVLSRGIVWSEAAPIPRHVTSPGDSVRAVDGAVWMTSVDVVDAIGELDEFFFLYYEETDWFARANAAGYSVQVMPGLTSVAASAPGADRVYYITRNGGHFLVRHATPAAAFWWLMKSLTLGLTRDLLRWGCVDDADSSFAVARLAGIRDFLFGRWGPRHEAGRRPLEPTT